MQLSNQSSSKIITIGISDSAVTSDPESQLITYALGSCLGLVAYDSVNHVGGMIHCLLPLSRNNVSRAKENPFMFVDTGVPLFLNRFFDMGGEKKNMVLKVAGCGNMMDEDGRFNIGQRNHTVLRKILWKNNLLIKAECVGGVQAKTMKLDMKTGEVLIKTSDGVFTI